MGPGPDVFVLLLLFLLFFVVFPVSKTKLQVGEDLMEFHQTMVVGAGSGQVGTIIYCTLWNL